MSSTSSRQRLKVFTDLQARLSRRRTSHLLLLLVHRRNEDGPEVWGANMSSGGAGPDPSPGPACVGMTPVPARDAGLRTPWWSEPPLWLLCLGSGAKTPHWAASSHSPAVCPPPHPRPDFKWNDAELSSGPGYPTSHFHPAPRSSCTWGCNIPIVTCFLCVPGCLETVTSARPCR